MSTTVFDKKSSVLKKLAKSLLRLPIRPSPRLGLHKETQTWRFWLSFVGVTVNVRMDDQVLELSTVLYRVPQNDKKDHHDPQDIHFILEHATLKKPFFLPGNCSKDEDDQAEIKCDDDLQQVIMTRRMPFRLLDDESQALFWKFINDFSEFYYQLGRNRVLDAQSACIKTKRRMQKEAQEEEKQQQSKEKKNKRNLLTKSKSLGSRKARSTFFLSRGTAATTSRRTIMTTTSHEKSSLLHDDADCIDKSLSAAVSALSIGDDPSIPSLLPIGKNARTKKSKKGKKLTASTSANNGTKLRHSSSMRMSSATLSGQGECPSPIDMVVVVPRRTS